MAATGHLAGPCDLLGEIVVGAEVVVVEEVDRERATPLRVDALDDPTLDDDRNRGARRRRRAAWSARPLRGSSPLAVACAARSGYWPGR